MNKDNQQKAVKKYSVYFTEEEYEYLSKKANEKCLRTGIYIKSLLMETLRNHKDLIEDKNPFRKSTKKL